MTARGPHHRPPDAAQRRADALRRAAQSKSDTATARAEAAIRQLVKNQQEITFRSVARTGGVSIDFLYAHAELRPRIESLRARQTATAQSQPDSRPAATNGSLVHILTTKLRDERAAHRATVTELEQRIAAAHGEILRLRRVLQQHGIEP